MNKIILIGRLVKAPEVKNTSTQVPVCKFVIAVNRKFRDKEGDKETDFINCVAWRQTANFIGSYFNKGSKIAIVGTLQIRTYEDNNGNKRYITEVVVDEAEFVESKSSQASTKPVSNNDMPYEVSDDFEDANETIEF